MSAIPVSSCYNSDKFIVNVYMRYESNDIIFDTSICDDKNMWRSAWGFDSQVIKLLNMYFEAIIFLFTVVATTSHND